MKTYEYKKTKSKHLFRVVNLEGNWKEYYNSKTKQFKRGLTTVLGRVWPKGEGYFKALKNATPEEWDKKMESAADQGDAVHQIIEIALSNNDRDEDGKLRKPVPINMAMEILAEDNKTKRSPTINEWNKYLSFVKFFNLHGIVILGHEWPAEHEKFVGTIDQGWMLTKSCGRDKKYCACVDFLNLKGINDVKTGKGLYANHKVQIACETYADHGFGEVKYTMLLHLNGTDCGWSVKFFNAEKTRINYERGLSAFNIDDDTYKPFDPERDIEDIPETAQLLFGSVAPQKEIKIGVEALPPHVKKVIKKVRKVIKKKR